MTLERQDNSQAAPTPNVSLLTVDYPKLFRLCYEPDKPSKTCRLESYNDSNRSKPPAQEL